MRKWNCILVLLLIAALLCGCGAKEAAAPTEPVDAVIAKVNGQEIHASDFEPYRQQYLVSYLAAGEDPADAAGTAYVEDAALTACIQDFLIQQDMQEQGCYTFDEATEAWFRQAGAAAYQDALAQAAEYLRDTLELGDGADLEKAALVYANERGVTEERYVQVFRDEYAAATYNAWLTRDCPVTEEDITAAYDAYVAESRERYGEDVAAFETAISAGEAVWYQPEGYRSVLQILLPAEGGEKIAEEIYTRLDAGEDFLALLAEYGTDANCKDESFLSTGYSVHPDSILWDEAFIAAAFGEDLTAPGTWSRTPLVSDKGVHILYYLKDAISGPAPLTDNVREALTYTIYQTRAAACRTARLEQLSENAKVEFPNQ